MRTLLFFSAVVACLLGTPQASFALLCAEPLPPLEALAYGDVVFVGTVIEIDEQPIEIELGNNKIEITLVLAKFKVDRSWKGVNGEGTIVLTQVAEIEDLYEFQLGKDYLVYGYIAPLPLPPRDEEEEYLQTSGCSRTKPLSAAIEDIEALGGPSSTLVKPALWGQIKALF